jgi:hypothetical protein
METKRVAYLLGAGASEGILKYADAEKSILMNRITEAISSRIANDTKGEFTIVRDELQNDLVEGANIEHLITLYEISGYQPHNDIAQNLKRLFREEIQNTIAELGTAFSPKLLLALIDMHSIEELKEELVLILTTNYEDLIERALQKMKGGINYVVGMNCSDPNYCIDATINPPLLKLHGSFNWKNGYPITVECSVGTPEDTIWIPPGVTKKRDAYPFNVIWGRARELLNCDILRIIGSSLTQNDWDLISLIHSTQRLRTDGSPRYNVEFIGLPCDCERIKKDYPYLNPKTYIEMVEFTKFAVDTYLPEYIGRPEPPEEERLKEVAKTIDESKMNVFEFWLRTKGDILLEQGVKLHTPEQFFEKFVKGES